MISQGRYISIIKAASSRASAISTGGEALGKAVRLLGIGAQKTQAGLGEAGGAVARGLGKNERIGKNLGKSIVPVLGTAGAAETDRGKRLRAQYGVLTPSEYGGSF